MRTTHRSLRVVFIHVSKCTCSIKIGLNAHFHGCAVIMLVPPDRASSLQYGPRSRLGGGGLWRCHGRRRGRRVGSCSAPTRCSRRRETVFFLQRSLLHLKRLLHSPLLFIMTGWVLLSPQEDGVGTLWTDLSLSDPGCFIGSCKAQTGSLRMASFSEKRRLCGNRGIRVE